MTDLAERRRTGMSNDSVTSSEAQVEVIKAYVGEKRREDSVNQRRRSAHKRQSLHERKRESSGSNRYLAGTKNPAQ